MTQELLNPEEVEKLQKKYSLDRGTITKSKFLNSVETITRLESEGYSHKCIWAYLTEHQMFDCTYQHFGRLFREWKRSRQKTQQQKITEKCPLMTLGTSEISLSYNISSINITLPSFSEKKND